MAKGNFVLLVLSVVLAVLVFFAPQIAWQTRLAIFGLAEEPQDSRLDVLELKAELAKFQSIKSQLPERPQNYILAVVLSRYPMNFKNEFLVNAGSVHGVGEKSAVVYGGVLIGRVAKNFEDTALVETVFDGNFQIPARVGARAVDALFKGGLAPKLVLIPLNADINSGDIVYSASPEVPYGLPIAEIKSVSESADKLFLEAALEFAYDISDIKSVLINTNNQ